MNAKLIRMAIVLGLLSVIGPVAIDMYLPALPEIGGQLGVTDASVQLSLMSFMAAFALGQLIYGPISDMIGRKPPLYIGTLVFIAGSIGCAVAPSVEWLIVSRFVQGIGGCAAMSLPRAIVRDEYTGAEAAQLFSLIMLVFSISPILAPLAGSVVIAFGDWRLLFWVMGAVGVFGLILSVVALKETRPKHLRTESTIGSAIRGYGMLLKDWNFLGLTFIGAFGMSAFMAFIGNSSFVFIEHYGLTPTEYSLAFSVNAVSFFAVSQSTGILVKRFGLQRVVRTAVTGFALSMALLAGIFIAGIDNMWVLSGLMFVAFGFLGLVLPTTGVLAMEEHGEFAGTASALMGTLQMVLGAVVMGIVGAFHDGTAIPMVLGFAICAILAFILTQVTIRTTVTPVVGAPAE
ncbi:Bcr/CflA family drug resistance efflux transporter [Devosia insulae DS-56]|uniref:Bcr/CflA family efflux transporter n=1 Tax=Devosia insulae DS-56 TaxID=1116389 RepID=A0A1E5XJQ2_9HYPH|nr:multidrug effflux MFS transporter [Devosia insulae]OEO28820.1 Bcr/CflA family drug resistance efflux transporter [Devosia insulae DS-56]